MENLNGFLPIGINPILGIFEKITAPIKEYKYENPDNYFFLCVIKGNFKILFDNAMFEIEDNKAYLFNSNRAGIFKLVSAISDLEIFLLEFKDAFFFNQYKKNENTNLIKIEVLDNDLCFMKSTLCNMLLAKEVYTQNNELIMSQLLIVLILAIIKSFHLEDKNQEKKDDLAANIKKYIDENYKDNISLNSISKIFFITSDYVSHIFKEEFGISPIKYLINKRINVSKYLLMNTNRSVNLIAFEVGYDNPAYFSSLFRKIEGISPANFRLSIKRNI